MEGNGNPTPNDSALESALDSLGIQSQSVNRNQTIKSVVKEVGRQEVVVLVCFSG